MRLGSGRVHLLDLRSNIPFGSALTCQATLSSGSKVRGSLTIYDGNGVPLRMSEVH